MKVGGTTTWILSRAYIQYLNSLCHGHMQVSLTIGIVHFGSKVRFDKDAGQAGGHVVVALSPGVLLQRKGSHKVIVPVYIAVTVRICDTMPYRGRVISMG